MTPKTGQSAVTRWQEYSAKELERDKFAPKDIVLTIYPDTEPKKLIVDGKYGKRDMYKVRTNIGNTLLSAVQLQQLVAVMANRGNWTQPFEFTFNRRK